METFNLLIKKKIPGKLAAIKLYSKYICVLQSIENILYNPNRPHICFFLAFQLFCYKSPTILLNKKKSWIVKYCDGIVLSSVKQPWMSDNDLSEIRISKA